MTRAIELAKRGIGNVSPNPLVGCVLVRDGAIIGEGYHAEYGQHHAEVNAVLSIENQSLLEGATAYVTLEPCAHHGRTPPCAQTLIDAEIRRVVVSTQDPDSRVDGKGFAMLKEAGIDVAFQNRGDASGRVLQTYLKTKTENRPFVTLKLAMTVDGVIGLKARDQLKLTGPVSNAQTHLLRSRHDAILVGIDTVLSDDPSLTCRLPGLEGRSPIRLVLDAEGKLLADHQVVKTAREYPTMVATPNGVGEAYLDLLKEHGVLRLACELANGRIALPELLDDLNARGIQSVLVEGGAKVAESFLDEALVDEIILLEAGNPETGDGSAELVFAPFTSENIPQGFEICEEMRFGDDRFLRLKRRIR